MVLRLIDGDLMQVDGRGNWAIIIQTSRVHQMWGAIVDWVGNVDDGQFIDAAQRGGAPSDGHG